MNLDKYLTLNKNEADLKKLLSILESGESVLFVGAGCSQNLGFPSWGQLIKELNERLCSNEIVIDWEDLLTSAKKIKERISEKDGNLESYYSFIRNRFKEPQSEEPVAGEENNAQEEIGKWKDSHFHKTIFNVPFKAFVTTNYDSAIEEYSKRYHKEQVSFCVPQAKGAVGDFLFRLHKEDLHQGVFHVHGLFDYPEDIILCKNDYEDVYTSKKSIGSTHKKSLWALFTTRPVVFVGFSLTDEYFMQLLKVICTDTWAQFKTNHFALVPFSDLEEGSDEKIKQDAFIQELTDKHSIKVIFYDPSGDHIQMSQLLECGISKTVEQHTLERGIEIQTEKKEVNSNEGRLTKVPQEILDAQGSARPDLESSILQAKKIMGKLKTKNNGN